MYCFLDVHFEWHKELCIGNKIDIVLLFTKPTVWFFEFLLPYVLCWVNGVWLAITINTLRFYQYTSSILWTKIPRWYNKEENISFFATTNCCTVATCLVTRLLSPVFFQHIKFSLPCTVVVNNVFYYFITQLDDVVIQQCNIPYFLHPIQILDHVFSSFRKLID